MRSAKAQLDTLDFPVEGSAYSYTDPRAALKQEVSERLAAHRSRKGQSTQPNLIGMTEPRPVGNAAAKPAKARSTRIAAAVAERYAHTQSYRDFLAAEAQRAIEEAHATAEIAARTAEAVTAVQQQLLAELDLWDSVDSDNTAETLYVEETTFAAPSFYETEREPITVESTVRSVAPGLTIRLYEDIGLRQSQIQAGSSNRNRIALKADHDASGEEHEALDEEIDFRRAPIFEAPASQATPIPANLIAFPRQLVASRRARPRLAEGPLRDEIEAQAAAQLRIFEVEANQISNTASPATTTALPEWSSIHLDASPARIPQTAPLANPADHVGVQLYVPLQAAPLNLRLMSAAVDACILGGAFLAAICTFAFAVNQIPTGVTAVMAAAGTLLVLFLAYHLLFFTFSDATPGMRYARIGLCTFGDENPTRSEMRRRTLAILLAACPLGLGLAWALLDEEGLGWHDRLSGMYQRSY